MSTREQFLANIERLFGVHGRRAAEPMTDEELAALANALLAIFTNSKHEKDASS